MSLIKFNRRRPWFSQELEDLFNSENLLREDFLNRSVLRQPAMNVREDEEKYELELAVPGLTREDFQVTVEDGYLTIAVEKETTAESTEDYYTRKEFNFERFHRSVLLPDDAREDEISANYEDGLLRIGIFKKDPETVSRVKKVEVD
ncbi:Hsp20/alpha crystallin family protein [Robertkochia flava]|uniref:Hsp20/alpha crystallin family protein n=1 Tax=Robertkochia flava TaxID=3447986 RepID=UPI001CCAE792|nr:Hsp20/alpha crystallin family protein [Robertkochia marina]